VATEPPAEEPPQEEPKPPAVEPQFQEGMSVEDAIKAVPQGAERSNMDSETLGKPLQEFSLYRPCKPGSARFKLRGRGLERESRWRGRHHHAPKTTSYSLHQGAAEDGHLAGQGTLPSTSSSTRFSDRQAAADRSWSQFQLPARQACFWRGFREDQVAVRRRRYAATSSGA
jgi:hypothetical protein